MSKERYEWYMGTSEIIDNKTKKFITQNCTELLNQQSQQIADIEAKLADAEFRYDNLHNLYYKDTEELKQQLAELKEKLKDALKDFNDVQEENDKLTQQLAEKEKQHIIDNQIVEAIEHNREKDKISFCIEKLKSIRREIVSFIAQRNNETFFIDGKKFRDYIDNEMKLLKKENKNV